MRTKIPTWSVVVLGFFLCGGAARGQQSFQFSVNGNSSHVEKAHSTTFTQLEIDVSAGNGSVIVIIEYHQSGVADDLLSIPAGDLRIFSAPAGATIKKVSLLLGSGVVAIGDGRLF